VAAAHLLYTGELAIRTIDDTLGQRFEATPNIVKLLLRFRNMEWNDGTTPVSLVASLGLAIGIRVEKAEYLERF
jgi:hypothetical protein